jgi:hypothetical protein
MNVDRKTFPEAFSSMDAAAKEFWAYPGPEWQEGFLRKWAQENNDAELEAALQ